MGLLRFLSLPVDDFWFSAILLILVRPFFCLGCRVHLGRFVLHDCMTWILKTKSNFFRFFATSRPGWEELQVMPVSGCSQKCWRVARVFLGVLDDEPKLGIIDVPSQSPL